MFMIVYYNQQEAVYFTANKYRLPGSIIMKLYINHTGLPPAHHPLTPPTAYMYAPKRMTDRVL